jgi:rhodanese-related sulfurtransferase
MNARIELPPAREVCPTTTRRLLAEGALLVDVRELAEVAQTAFDMPGVVLLPLSELQQRHAELPRDHLLVLASQGDERSLKATYFLMVQGYTQVAHMQGGIEKWARKGFPIRGAVPLGLATAAACCGAPVPSEAASCCDSPASAAISAKCGCC